MSARKIGMLILLLAVGGSIETAWQVRHNLAFGPHGCRVMGGRFFGPSHSFEQADERPIGSEPRIRVKNAFGEVRVAAGPSGLVRARLRKVVYQASQERARAFAERIELRLAVDGSSATVGTNRDALGRADDVGFETHLELEVPPDSVVEVHNEHGHVDLAGLRAAEVVSSFDGVSVERLTGALKLDSRHGEVRVSDLGGPLELVSRHGEVQVSDLRGPATIDSQHGAVTVRHSRRLEIRQQHGAVTAEGIDGELVVRAGHAEVNASDVRAGADVETSFAGVSLARVGGDARVKVEHGRVGLEDVAGAASVESSFDGIDLDRVGGPAELLVHHGGVEGRGLFQGARVRASGGDVVLDGFSGPIDVELERGGARLFPRAIISAPVTVSVKHGDAELALPEGGDVTVEARSRRGEIRTEADELRVTDEQQGPGPGRRLNGRMGQGGVTVKLNTDGDVRISTRTPSAVSERPIAGPDLSETRADSPPAEQAP